MIMKHVVNIQALFLQRWWENFVILILIYKSMGYNERITWIQEQMYKFVDHLLWSLWTEEIKFRKWTRVKYITFIFLGERLGPYLKKRKKIRFRDNVPVQGIIAISLHKLACGNGLQSIGDLYAVHKNTLSNNKEIL